MPGVVPMTSSCTCWASVVETAVRCLSAVHADDYLSFCFDFNLHTAYLVGLMTLANRGVGGVRGRQPGVPADILARWQPRLVEHVQGTAARSGQGCAVVRQLFTVQRLGKAWNSPWLGAFAGHLLSQCLAAEPLGVASVLTAIFQDIHHGGPPDSLLVGNVARLLSTLPLAFSRGGKAGVYYASICSQVLRLFETVAHKNVEQDDQSGGERAGCHRQILVDFVLLMVDEKSAVAEKYLLTPLFQPLFALADGKKVLCEDVLVCLKKLDMIISSRANSTAFCEHSGRYFDILMRIYELDFDPCGPTSESRLAKTIIKRMLLSLSPKAAANSLINWTLGADAQHFQPSLELKYFAPQHQKLCFVGGEVLTFCSSAPVNEPEISSGSGGSSPGLVSLAGLGRAAVVVELLKSTTELANKYTLILLRISVSLMFHSSSASSAMADSASDENEHNLAGSSDLERDVKKRESNACSSSALLDLEERSNDFETSMTALTLVAGVLENFQSHLQKDSVGLVSVVKLWLQHYSDATKFQNDADHDDTSTVEAESIKLLVTFLGIMELSSDSGLQLSRDMSLMSQLDQLSRSHPRAEVRAAVQELMIILNSAPSTSKTSSDINHVAPKSEFSVAMEGLRGAVLPSDKGHHLVTLAGLLMARDSDAIERIDDVLDVVLDQVRNEDSYVYLCAINALQAAGDLVPDRVLDALLGLMESTTASDATGKRDKGVTDTSQALHPPVESVPLPTRPVEHRLKVAEAVVKIVRRLGDLGPHYFARIIERLFPLCSEPDEYVAASALSSLGEMCKLASYRISTCLYEVLMCLSNAVASKLAQPMVRRAAIHVIRLLLEGCSKDMLAKTGDAILTIYRIVKRAALDGDEVVQLHAAICKSIIDDSMLEILRMQSGGASDFLHKIIIPS